MVERHIVKTRKMTSFLAKGSCIVLLFPTPWLIHKTSKVISSVQKMEDRMVNRSNVVGARSFRMTE